MGVRLRHRADGPPLLVRCTPLPCLPCLITMRSAPPTLPSAYPTVVLQPPSPIMRGLGGSIHSSSTPHNNIRYHTIPHHTTQYCTIPYDTMVAPSIRPPHHTITYNTTPHHTIPHHTTQYCTIPCDSMVAPSIRPLSHAATSGSPPHIAHSMSCHHIQRCNRQISGTFATDTYSSGGISISIAASSLNPR